MSFKTLPGNGEETTGGSCMERCPTFMIPTINICSMFNQKLHHIEVIINAGLENNTRLTFLQLETLKKRYHTWWRAVRPSTLGVSMSAPWRMSLRTSSLSPAAQAERKTHPSENWIRLEDCRAVGGSLLVSDSSHRLSCSALLNRAEFVLDSIFFPIGKCANPIDRATGPSGAPKLVCRRNDRVN